jgi:8-oxo-dGTP pyrophosphatase MutT (NUDIX family)
VCAAAWAGDLGPAAAVAAAVAALRELFEEAGVLLTVDPDGRLPDVVLVADARSRGATFAELVVGLDLRLRTDLLVPLSRWVTPPVDVPRRYDARFFVAALPDGVAVSPDAAEVIAHQWTLRGARRWRRRISRPASDLPAGGAAGS